MIYSMVQGALGPHGRWLLELITEHQLILATLIVGFYLVHRLRGWGRSSRPRGKHAERGYSK